MSTEATKAVLNTPCVDRYGGKCLSRDNSKAVPSDRFGKPKSDKKRGSQNGKGNGKGNGNNDGGPNSKKAKNNNNKNGNNKKVCIF